MHRRARSSNKCLHTMIDEDSLQSHRRSLTAVIHGHHYRVSAVFFLKAKPNIAMRLSLTVLNRLSMIVSAKRRRCHSFITITCTSTASGADEGDRWDGGSCLHPVVSHVWQVKALAEVDQVEHVLLEAATAEADRCVQELAADARVLSHCVRHFADVRACSAVAARACHAEARVARAYRLPRRWLRCC